MAQGCGDGLVFRVFCLTDDRLEDSLLGMPPVKVDVDIRPDLSNQFSELAAPVVANLLWGRAEVVEPLFEEKKYFQNCRVCLRGEETLAMKNVRVRIRNQYYRYEGWLTQLTISWFSLMISKRPPPPKTDSRDPVWPDEMTAFLDIFNVVSMIRVDAAVDVGPCSEARHNKHLRSSETTQLTLPLANPMLTLEAPLTAHEIIVDYGHQVRT